VRTGCDVLIWTGDRPEACDERATTFFRVVLPSSNRRLRRARSPVTKDRTEFIRSVVLPHLYCALIARFRRYEADDLTNSATPFGQLVTQ
jgi:hypothetical protein